MLIQSRIKKWIPTFMVMQKTENGQNYPGEDRARHSTDLNHLSQWVTPEYHLQDSHACLPASPFLSAAHAPRVPTTAISQFLASLSNPLWNLLVERMLLHLCHPDTLPPGKLYKPLMYTWWYPY